MAASWTTITNAQVAAGAPLTTALATGLRDRPDAIAQRAAGAIKAFNVPYNYQEFTSNGTWTKPSDAETGDEVFVEVVGGGEGGSSSLTGGAGGTGIMVRYDMDQLGSTEAVVVGAGGGAGGVNGGKSSFGTSGSIPYISAFGGDRDSEPIIEVGASGTSIPVGVANDGSVGVQLHRGTNGGAVAPERNTLFGGGGGGNGSGTPGGVSGHHGNGGTGSATVGEDGQFPGGGGGSGPTGGSGADGVVRVYCIKRS